MDLDAEIDAYIAGEYVAEGTVDDEPPVLDGVDHVDRMLAGVAYLEREIRDVTVAAARRIADMEAWREDRVSGMRKSIERMERSLEGWTRAAVAENPKRQTYHLPNGTVQLRKGRNRVAVLGVDPERAEALLDTLQSLDDELVVGTRKVAPVRVQKIAEPGAVLADVPAPEGYAAHEAIVRIGTSTPDAADGAEVEQVVALPGVAFLVPVGQVFAYKPAGRNAVTEEPAAAVETIEEAAAEPVEPF